MFGHRETLYAMTTKTLCFLSIIGEPGTFDASVYDHLNGGDDECVWFTDAFAHVPGITIRGYNVCRGEAPPDPGDGDMFVLGGSYNFVNDHFPWQLALRPWFDALRASGKPLFAICGGHQLLCHHLGGRVSKVPTGTVAGTMAVDLSEEGRVSPVFAGLGDAPQFHFANEEYVVSPPAGSTILASHAAMVVSALDFGGGWFSAQFHPEASPQTMAPGWRTSHPEFCDAYTPSDAGRLMLENFIAHATAQAR